MRSLALEVHAGDAAALHAFHHDPKAVERQLLPRAGHAPERRVDEPTDGGHGGMLEAATERGGEVVERHAAVHPIVVSLLADRRSGLDVVLVADVADHLL